MSTSLENRDGAWRRRVGRLAGTLLNTLLPPACAYCGRPDHMLCPDCRASILWVQEPICQLCGRPDDGRLCRACVAQPPSIQRIRAATHYHDPVKRLLHRLKYEDLFALGQPLGQLMVEVWPLWQEPADLVLSIPLHSRRLSERGYNQSEFLAGELRRHLALPDDSQALKRRRATRPQMGLTAVERRANVNGAFVADPARVEGKRVLLVDDVCTTGSTLNAAATALLESGANSVAAYCLCTAVERQGITYV